MSTAHQPEDAADRGVVYLAFGDLFLAMALRSAATVKELDPSVGTCIVTNVASPSVLAPATRGLVDHWVHSEQATSDNRLTKVRILDHAPFDKTVYLDADTLVLGHLRELFVMLDWFDVAVRLNPFGRGGGKGRWEVLGGLQTGQLPHWNSGVIAFRRGAGARDFFDAWSNAYARVGASSDQVSLVEAVFNTGARVLSLDVRWNCPLGLHLARGKEMGTKVLHYTSKMPRPVAAEILRQDAQMRTAAGIPPAPDLEQQLQKRTLRPFSKSWLSALGHRAEALLRRDLR